MSTDCRDVLYISTLIPKVTIHNDTEFGGSRCTVAANRWLRRGPVALLDSLGKYFHSLFKAQALASQLYKLNSSRLSKFVTTIIMSRT